MFESAKEIIGRNSTMKKLLEMTEPLCSNCKHPIKAHGADGCNRGMKVVIQGDLYDGGKCDCRTPQPTIMEIPVDHNQ